MNLTDRIKQYLHLRKLNVRNAWLKSDLTNDDYWLITIIACFISIALTLKYADNLDGDMENERKRVKQAQNAVYGANKSIHQQELIIISMLQGRVKIDGVSRTVCLMTAAGDCI